MWGQKAPPKHENGGKKRPQNHKVGAENAPTQIRVEKVWRQKAPSKQQSDGKKRHNSNQSEKVMVAESAIKMEKWWRKTPSNKQSDGRKCHYFSNLVELQPHISNCGGALTTTYHIQGAGAPAKTKNYVNADGVYIFSGKGPTFSASCKTSEHYF